MSHYAHGGPKDHGKKPDKDPDQGECMRGEFVQGTSHYEKNRNRYQADEQRKFSALLKMLRAGLT